MQQTASSTAVHTQAPAHNQASGRLKNGVTAGVIARVYRQHQMRFARVKHVVAGIGIKANVKVQYLDYGQEEATVFGNIVQPVTRGWIEDMRDRFEEVKDTFEPSINGPASMQAEPGQRKLKNGITSDSLVRVYRDHQMRFARVLRIDRSALPTSTNVAIEYLDGDQEESHVMGRILQPVAGDWIRDLEARIDAVSKLLASERAMRTQARTQSA